VLYIILGIIAFILILLCIPVQIEAKYSSSLSLTIKYLFIPFQLTPKKESGKFAQFWNDHIKKHFTAAEKKIKKARIWLKNKFRKKKKTTDDSVVTKPKKEEKSSFSQLIEARGFSGMIALLWRVFLLATGAFGKIFKSTFVQRFDFNAKIGGDDAAEIAVNYGKWCAVLYPLLAMVLASTRRYRKNIEILPDFNYGQTEVVANVLLQIFPIVALTHAAAAFLKLFFLEIKDSIKQKIAEASAQASANIKQGGAV